MKNTVRVNRTIAIMMIVAALIVGLFGTQKVFAGETTLNAVGNIEEQNAEFVREALAKALEAKGTAVEAEPVVEGATGNVETEATAITFEATESAVEARVEYAANSMSFEATDGIVLEDAEVAQTANASATATAATTIDSTITETPDDEMGVNFGAVEANYTSASVNAKYLSTPNGEKRAFTVIGDDTLYNSLQKTIDAGNIVCWPSCDMSKGVKYFAGHNPGRMSHVAGLKVGSVVRLSNEEGYQDYKILEIVQAPAGTGFGNIQFKTAGTNLWTLLTQSTHNGVVVQYCVNGISTLHYGVAI